jgi:hypothetical protein
VDAAPLDARNAGVRRAGRCRLGSEARREHDAGCTTGEAGVELRLAAAARDWLADAEAAGHGDEDYSAVLEQIIET